MILIDGQRPLGRFSNYNNNQIKPEIETAQGVSNVTFIRKSERLLYSVYRTAVFFWILIGMTWIGGMVSLVKDNIKIGMKKIVITMTSLFLKSKNHFKKG